MIHLGAACLYLLIYVYIGFPCKNVIVSIYICIVCNGLVVTMKYIDMYGNASITYSHLKINHVHMFVIVLF